MHEELRIISDRQTSYARSMSELYRCFQRVARAELSTCLQPQVPRSKALVDYARTACGQQYGRVVFEADAHRASAWRTAKAEMHRRAARLTRHARR